MLNPLGDTQMAEADPIPGHKKPYVFLGGPVIAFGNTCINILAIDYVVRRYSLRALVVPDGIAPELWEDVFRNTLVKREEMPDGAVFWPDRPIGKRKDGPPRNVVEEALWAIGCYDTGDLLVDPPIIAQCDPEANAVMIYPNERTGGNRVFGSTWWIEACCCIRACGMRINYLGTERNPVLAELHETVPFDECFPATVTGLKACIAKSSLALGGNTGPTWACLFSDIPQIVLESRQATNLPLWEASTVGSVLAKRIRGRWSVHHTLHALLLNHCADSNVAVADPRTLAWLCAPSLPIRRVSVDNTHPSRHFSPDVHLVDGLVRNSEEKWCAAGSGACVLEFSLSVIDRVTIFHGGILESSGCNTRDFSVAVRRQDGTWRVVDQRVGNCESVTNHPVGDLPCDAVKVSVSRGSDDGWLRIYEIKIHGRVLEGGDQ